MNKEMNFNFQLLVEKNQLPFIEILLLIEGIYSATHTVYDPKCVQSEVGKLLKMSNLSFITI
jgi:hypothetical protein